MAIPLIISNVFLKASASAVRDLLRPSSAVRLYQTNSNPGPASTPRDFVEGGFGGYARIDLNFILGPVVKIADGLYGFDTPQMKFICTGPPFTTIFGTYVATNANWSFARNFPLQIAVTTATVIKLAFRFRFSSA